jgi:sulfotransferase
MKAIHFISGTPRSGSTLLSAILRQNPLFYASISSPVMAMVNGIYSALGAQQEWTSLATDKQRESSMRAVIEGFYEEYADKVVFDTSRGWCARMGIITKLYPNARVIACVREFPWIIDSFERLHQQNPLLMSKLFNMSNGNTVYARADTLAGTQGTVGYPSHAVREAVFGPHGAKLILVDYEALTREPAATMEYLYKELEVPLFKHDFNNVQYEADEFDAQLGVPGLHTVRRKVEFMQRKTILPPDLFERFKGGDSWRDKSFTRLGISACVVTSA